MKNFKKGQRIKIIGNPENDNKGQYKGYLGNVSYIRGDSIYVILDFTGIKKIKLHENQVVPYDIARS